MTTSSSSSAFTRRDIIRKSATAAAVAVPMAAVARPAASGAADLTEHEIAAELDVASSGPVMFCVHDAARGEVAILQGETEVVVHDRTLVARVLRAARAQQMV
jgi:hypothetical protein